MIMGPKSLFMIHTLATQMTRDGSDQWVRFFSTASHFYCAARLTIFCCEKGWAAIFIFTAYYSADAKTLACHKNCSRKGTFVCRRKSIKDQMRKNTFFTQACLDFSGIMEVGRRWWWRWFYCWWERTVIILVLMIDALPSISPTRLSLVLC